MALFQPTSHDIKKLNLFQIRKRMYTFHGRLNDQLQELGKELILCAGLGIGTGEGGSMSRSGSGPRSSLQDCRRSLSVEKEMMEKMPTDRATNQGRSGIADCDVLGDSPFTGTIFIPGRVTLQDNTLKHVAKLNAAFVQLMRIQENTRVDTRPEFWNSETGLFFRTCPYIWHESIICPRSRCIVCNNRPINSIVWPLDGEVFCGLEHFQLFHDGKSLRLIGSGKKGGDEGKSSGGKCKDGSGKDGSDKGGSDKGSATSSSTAGTPSFQSSFSSTQQTTPQSPQSRALSVRPLWQSEILQVQLGPSQRSLSGRSRDGFHSCVRYCTNYLGTFTA